jgi:serine/threonine-protein kinase RsbW
MGKGGEGAERPDPRVTRVNVRLEARLSNRSLAIDLVATLVDHVKTADRNFRNAVTTAFGEAFNNVVIHGYKDRSDGMLEVEAELGAEHITLELMDEGAQADLSRVEAPDLDALPEGGLGVFMIHALVDEVVYQSGSPNVLRLTKRTTPRPGPDRESASK